jgi:hypothetical protein
MKYMLFLADDGSWMQAPREEIDRMYGKIGEWWGRHAQAGTIVEGSQLQPRDTATTVRFNGAKPVVTDGPFIEAKESIGGYAIIKADNLDKAIEFAKSWPAGGVVEIRPVLEREGM